jgi:small subunit ribosomal protein S6
LNDAILRHLSIKLEPRLVEPMLAVARGEAPSRVFSDVVIEPADSEETEIVSA